jgi:hypothetical protein
LIRCSQCGEEHDVFAIEPRYARPDAFVRIPPEERDSRTHAGDDWCRLRDASGQNQQWFLRVTLPFEVRGEGRLLNWGVWVEVSETVYARVMELWEEENQASEPPLPAAMANELPGYPSTLGLQGTMRLQGRNTAPRFILQPELHHPLAAEQRSGIYPERALEWVSPFIH